MAQRSPQGLATFPESSEGNGERALFVAVLRQALRDDDAMQWLQTVDGHLVCALAGFEPEYLTRKLVAR
jgi:hypothetical protein